MCLMKGMRRNTSSDFLACNDIRSAELFIIEEALAILLLEPQVAKRIAFGKCASCRCPHLTFRLPSKSTQIASQRRSSPRHPWERVSTAQSVLQVSSEAHVCFPKTCTVAIPLKNVGVCFAKMHQQHFLGCKNLLITCLVTAKAACQCAYEPFCLCF